MNTSITSVRALAFLAVFLFHSSLKFEPGYLGVQIFFVLSGFLIIPNFLEMKDNLSKKQLFVNFFGRRALRIFPLYFFYLFVITIICYTLSAIGYKSADIDNFLASKIWAITYTYNFYHATDSLLLSKFVTHFWSLAVEEQFYLIWPLLLFFVRKEHTKALLFCVVLLGPLLRLVTAELVKSEVFPFVMKWTEVVVYVLPTSHIDAFAWGGIFALYGNARKPHYTLLAIAGILSFGFMTQYIYEGQIKLSSWGFPLFMKDKYVIGYTAVNIFFAFMLRQISQDKIIPPLFKNPFLHYLGLISYGLYVYHYACIWFVQQFPGVVGRGWVADCTSLLLTILLAAISYNFFEVRFIDLKDRYFPKNAPRDARCR